jgi:phospholipid transport system substrate-binding protein
VAAIAEFVLGRHWRGASTASRAEFTTAFAAYLVAMYAPRVAGYGDVAFTVRGQTVQSDGSLMVATEVARRDPAPPAVIDWRAVQDGDGFKITDLVIDGVSMMRVKREEIGSVFDYTHDGMTVLLEGAAALVSCG